MNASCTYAQVDAFEYGHAYMHIDWIILHYRLFENNIRAYFANDHESITLQAAACYATIFGAINSHYDCNVIMITQSNVKPKTIDCCSFAAIVA